MLIDEWKSEVHWRGRHLPQAAVLEAMAFAQVHLWPGDIVQQDAITKTIELAGWYNKGREVEREAIQLGRVKAQYVGKCPACGAEFIVTKPKQRYCCQVCSDEGLRVSHRQSRTKTKTIPQK